MAIETQTSSDAGAFVVRPSATEIDAGASTVLSFEIGCSPPRDLRGQTLYLFDADGEPAGSAGIIAFDGGVSRTAELTIDAPAAVGEQTWSAAVAAGADDVAGAPAVEFTLNVRAHATTLLVWDVPTAVTAGDHFAVTLGLKCSAACAPSGRHFEIYDHKGTKIAAGAFGAEIWPGTAAVYHAKATLTLPTASPGRYEFEVRVPPGSPALPHEGAAATFAIRVVPLPDCVLTVEAVDRESQAPLAGAQVVMHPYRATTDANGSAQLMVPKGDYRLLVSASRYISGGQPMSIAGDATARVQLMLEPRQTIASIYSTPVRSNATQGNH